MGRLLGLPFPGGPNIERAALDGNPLSYEFPRARLDMSYDFSFSGLKTAVMREATVMPSAASRRHEQGAEKHAQLRTDISVSDLAASFQRAVVTVLAEKTARAAKQYQGHGNSVSGRCKRQSSSARHDAPIDRPASALSTAQPLHRQRRHDRGGGALPL